MSSEPKPYYDAEVFVHGVDNWLRVKTFKQLWRARDYCDGQRTRRIVRVHPDGRREVVE